MFLSKNVKKHKAIKTCDLQIWLFWFVWLSYLTIHFKDYDVDWHIFIVMTHNYRFQIVLLWFWYCPDFLTHHICASFTIPYNDTPNHRIAIIYTKIMFRASTFLCALAFITFASGKNRYYIRLWWKHVFSKLYFCMNK